RLRLPHPGGAAAAVFRAAVAPGQAVQCHPYAPVFRADRVEREDLHAGHRIGETPMNRVGPKTVAQPQPKTTSEASAKTEVATTQPKTWGPTERTRGAQQVIPGSQGSEI